MGVWIIHGFSKIMEGRRSRRSSQLPNSAQSRRWCITANEACLQGLPRCTDEEKADSPCQTNLEEEQCDLIQSFAKRILCTDGVKFAIGQLERGESGNLHAQAYIRFTGNHRLSNVRSIFPGAHAEVAKGNEADNIAYCTKTESALGGGFAIGQPASQGKRNDIFAVKDIIDEGKGMRDVMDVIASYPAIKFAEMYLKYHEKPRDFMPIVYWYHGSSRSGKSREAFSKATELHGRSVWWSGKNLKWFEGYDAHQCIIVDDFRKDFCTFHELLRICDRYEYRIENKGGSRQLKPRTIFITCPWSPAELYKNQGEQLEQLTLRLSEIKLFGNIMYRNEGLFVPHDNLFRN